MKLIIIFSILFSFNSLACSTKTVAELESCQVKDKWQEILSKIRPNEEWVLEPRQNINDTRTPFERLSMNNKPTPKEFSDALEAWKNEVRPRVQYREDLDGLKYAAMGAARCGFGRPNFALLKRDMLKDLDQEKLTCLKQKESEIQAEIDDIKSKQTQIKMIRQALKDYDCTTITEDYAKKICEYNKLRF